MVVKATDDRLRCDAAYVLDGTMDWSVFAKRPIGPQLVIMRNTSSGFGVSAPSKCCARFFRALTLPGSRSVQETQRSAFGPDPDATQSLVKTNTPCVSRSLVAPRGFGLTSMMLFFCSRASQNRRIGACAIAARGGHHEPGTAQRAKSVSLPRRRPYPFESGVLHAADIFRRACGLGSGCSVRGSVGRCAGSCQ